MPFSKKYYVVDTLECPPTVLLFPSIMVTSVLKFICITAMLILKICNVCVCPQTILLFSYLPKCYINLHPFYFLFFIISFKFIFK